MALERYNRLTEDHFAQKTPLGVNEMVSTFHFPVPKIQT